MRRPELRAIGGQWRTACRRVLAGIAVVLALACLGPSASAQDAPSPAPKMATSVSIDIEPSRMDGIPHYLTARVVAEDGSAVVGERVQIRRTADVFGGRDVTIGRAVTDNAGIARVPIEPREEFYAVKASFGGSESLAPSEVGDNVVFPLETVIVPEHAPIGGLVDPRIRPLADVMPLAIGVGVIAVWAVLLGLTAVTVVRIRSSRRSDPSASGQVSAEVPGTGPGSQHG